MIKIFGCIIFITFVITNINEATLSPKTSKESKTKTKKVSSGPIDKSVVELNLVTTDPTAKDIIKNHHAYFKDTNEFHVDGISLGYVTPWNNHGYDIAKIFANKFTHISPVWLQLKRTGKLGYDVTGMHDIDKSWMKDVIKAGRKRQVKIVPRVLLEEWKAEDFRAVFENNDEALALATTFANACNTYNFKGFVLEGWSQLFGHVNSKVLVDVINLIATRLTHVGCQTILVLPPRRDDDRFNSFTKVVFNQLYDVVTAFSLMTYDFSSVQRPGPNAPLPWIRECVEFLAPDESKRKKILTGLNFYGHAYTPNGGDAIIGSQYLDLLKKFKGKMPYDPNSAENYLEVKDGYQRFIVFYPTLHSIKKRIDLIKELGTGIAIWELGQGLDYFYDLV